MQEHSPFLDKRSKITIKTGGKLPHWEQDGKLQYVTFRLADSLPQSKLKVLKDFAERFEFGYPKPWSLKVKKEFRSKIGPLEEKLLHNGYGNCVLANSGTRKILEDAIFYRDNIDYYVYAFVIMPNHVHMLIQPMMGKKLEDILHSIKRYSAYKINKRLNQSGRLWFKESYDHIVRDDDEMKHCYSYIQGNPRFLPPDRYTLYVI